MWIAQPWRWPRNVALWTGDWAQQELNDQGELFQAQGFWDASKKKEKFDRVKGEVGEDMGQKGSGKQGALSPLSPISPSLPSQLFSPCGIEATGIPPRHSREKTFCRVIKQFFRTSKASCFSFSQVVEPINRFFPKKKLISAVS